MHFLYEKRRECENFNKMGCNWRKDEGEMRDIDGRTIQQRPTTINGSNMSKIKNNYQQIQ